MLFQFEADKQAVRSVKRGNMQAAAILYYLLLGLNFHM